MAIDTPAPEFLTTREVAALLRIEGLTLFKSLGVGLTILGVGFALGEKLALPGPAQGGWVGELAVFASAAPDGAPEPRPLPEPDHGRPRRPDRSAIHVRELAGLFVHRNGQPIRL